MVRGVRYGSGDIPWREEYVMDLVIYHGDCRDGFAAAWLCSKVWPSAEYMPATHGRDVQPYIVAAAGKMCVMVDFCFDRDAMLEMSRVSKSLMVIDHHVSRRDIVLGMPNNYYREEYSGAELTRRYLLAHPDTSRQVSDRWLGDNNWVVAYVQDRDLWRWSLADSRQVNDYIRCVPMEFERWDHLFLNCTIQNAALAGAAIGDYKRCVVGEHTRWAKLLRFAGYDAVVCHSTVSSLFSDIADTLLMSTEFKDCGVAIVYSSTQSGSAVSLRSRENGVDVSVIAKALGGGGHRRASGFSISEHMHSGNDVDILSGLTSSSS